MMTRWTEYLFDLFARSANYPLDLRKKAIDTLTYSLCVDAMKRDAKS